MDFGRYKLKNELGRGGMATVYCAYDSQAGRDVALKVLPKYFLHDPVFMQRFEREAQSLAQIEHHAVVPIYDIGQHEGLPYIAMRIMSGGTLADRIKAQPLSIADCVRFLTPIAHALDKMHRMGIVHRDLKPSNILFDEDAFAYLSDFGLVKLLEPSDSRAALSSTGQSLGTPAYMSPEQVEGVPLDGRSDIYALGIVLFEALTQRLPFHSETQMGYGIKHLQGKIPSILKFNSTLPSETEAILIRALAKRPEARYQTCADLLNALDELISQPTQPAVEVLLAQGERLQAEHQWLELLMLAGQLQAIDPDHPTIALWKAMAAQPMLQESVRFQETDSLFESVVDDEVFGGSAEPIIIEPDDIDTTFSETPLWGWTKLDE